jgi:hypothetical protein
VAPPYWCVERSFAWLGSYRRLLIRWEHLFAVYRRCFAFAILLLCVRRMAATSGRGDVHGGTASATMPPRPGSGRPLKHRYRHYEMWLARLPIEHVLAAR